MGDKMERVSKTALEKRLAELQSDDRYMSVNDQLVHLEVQGMIREQQAAAETIAKMRVQITRLADLVDSMVLDRAELKSHVQKLQAECEQMHVRQNATDARLDVIQAVFESGLNEFRSIVSAESKKLDIVMEDLSDKSEP